jgi:hypothetical protein
MGWSIGQTAHSQDAMTAETLGRNQHPTEKTQSHPGICATKPVTGVLDQRWGNLKIAPKTIGQNNKQCTVLTTHRICQVFPRRTLTLKKKSVEVGLQKFIEPHIQESDVSLPPRCEKKVWNVVRDVFLR